MSARNSASILSRRKTRRRRERKGPRRRAGDRRDGPCFRKDGGCTTEVAVAVGVPSRMLVMGRRSSFTCSIDGGVGPPASAPWSLQHGRVPFLLLHSRANHLTQASLRPFVDRF